MHEIFMLMKSSMRMHYQKIISILYHDQNSTNNIQNYEKILLINLHQTKNQEIKCDKEFLTENQNQKIHHSNR